jgi:hypothetical protein
VFVDFYETFLGILPSISLFLYLFRVVVVSNFAKVSRKSSLSTTWLTRLRTDDPSGFMLGIWTLPS